MPKKILYVITKSNWGGAQRYVYDCARSINKNEFEPVVAAGGNGILVGRLNEAGIRTIQVHSFVRNISIIKEFAAFRELLSIYKKERPAVIHLNSSKAGGIGALSAWVYGWMSGVGRPRVIFTVHGWGFDEPRSAFERALILGASVITTFFVDRIICIHSADAERTGQFTSKRKIAFIPNGIERMTYLSKSDARHYLAQAIKTPLPADRLILGTIGEFTKNKGHEYLLQALKELKEKKFPFLAVWIGEGELKESLQKSIQALDLEKHIFLTGFLDNAQTYLPAFDLFILPSLKEGLPYTILEAMDAGAPTLATRVGGIPDLIETEKTGLLVPPKDAYLLGRAILEAQPDVLERYADEAAQRIQKNFRLDRMIKETTALYEAKK